MSTSTFDRPAATCAEAAGGRFSYDASITADSLRYGLRVAERLFAAAGAARRASVVGSHVPELKKQSVREVVETPYRIVSRVGADVISILGEPLPQTADLLPALEEGNRICRQCVPFLSPFG